MQNVPDPYRLLGVGRDASVEQIKAAHRRLAKRYHPDAPEGNRTQFLAVQEAYQLLADPLRRRQWDARHAGGPVRADDQPGRVRPRPTNGHGPAPRGGRFDETRSSRTWSARGVPWWEEGESARARRPPGRQRPHEPGAQGASAQGAAAQDTSRESRREDASARRPERPSSASDPKGRRAGSASGRRTGATDRPAGSRRERAPGRAEGPPLSDFEVYSRSSGAAWSSAARAYFRRGVDDLPRGRAPWATRPRPRRNPESAAETASQSAEAAREPGAPGSSSPRGDAHDAGARSDARQSSAAPRTGASGWGQAGRPPLQAEPSVAGPTLGTAPRFTSQGPHAGLARARRWAIAGRGQWPSLFQRLVFAVAGWLPPALALAYTSGNLSGCDRASVSCPANFELLQFLAVAGLLAALLALPRAAYLAAAGSAGLGLTAALLVIVYSVAGVAQPLPQPVALLTLGFWLAGYVLGAFAAANDWPVSRPWLREGWINGPGGRAPNLGVARRVSRSRLSGR